MEWSEKRRGLAFSALFAALAAFFVSCGEDKIVASGNFDVRRFSDLPACDAAYEGLLARVRDWDADYFCNGEMWVLRGEKPSKCDSSGIMKDYRDGKSYRCLDWGHGVWMRDNLNLGKFETGESRQSATIWTETRKHCRNDSEVCVDGALYAWTTALLVDTMFLRMEPSIVLDSPHRGLCPAGWHVPTEKEFKDAFGDDEALDRLWPSLKDPAIVAFFQSEVWTAGDVYCSKKLSGGTDVQVEMEWGEVECRSANGYAERRLRCVQD